MTQTTRRSSGEKLWTLAADLTALSNGLAAVAENIPADHARMSLNQLLIFMYAGMADAKGSPLTLTDIVEALGETSGASIVNTYKAFLEPTKVHPKRMGWLYQEADPHDNRRKYLRTTPKGRALLTVVVESMNRSRK